MASTRAAVAAPTETVSLSCSNPRIVVEGNLSAHWAEAALALCESLAQRSNLDAQVDIRILPAGQAVILEATLADGRTALRRVRTPADLGPTFNALATVLPSEAETVMPRPPVATAVAPTPPRLAVNASAKSLPQLGVELGVALDGRFEGSPSYASTGPSGYASLRTRSWGIGFLARWQLVQSLVRSAPASLEMDTVALGFFAARRFTLAPAVRIDLGLAASMLVETQSILVDDDDELTKSAVVARVGPVTRLSLGDGAWRFVVSLDADVSPSRLRRSTRVDSAAPTLPAYGIGLAVGTSWGSDAR